MLAAQELPERHGHRAPARVRAVRHAAARRSTTPRRRRSGRRRRRVLDAVRAEVAVVPRAALRPLPAALLARLRGRLRGRLLQLQVGRGAVRGRLQPVRGGRACCRPTAGARFRDEVLARGGSRPALESFVAFRGPAAPTRRASAA